MRDVFAFASRSSGKQLDESSHGEGVFCDSKRSPDRAYAGMVVCRGPLQLQAFAGSDGTLKRWALTIAATGREIRVSSVASQEGTGSGVVSKIDTRGGKCRVQPSQFTNKPPSHHLYPLCILAALDRG